MNHLNKFFFWCWGISSNWWINWNINIDNIEKVLIYAFKKWITNYDTALVYWNWLWEKMFSKIDIKKDIFISTKIPAIKKPIKKNIWEIWKYYNKEHIDFCIKQSLDNFQREYIDLLFLHNWNKNWDINIKKILSYIKEYKKKWIVKNIWISLRDDYDWSCEIIAKSWIDYIQIPHNIFNEKILNNNYKYFKKNKVKILIRSIFSQWIILNDYNNLSKNDLRYSRHQNDILEKKTILNNYLNENKLKWWKTIYNHILTKYLNDNRIDWIILWLKNFKQIDDFIYYLNNIYVK